MPLTPFDPPTYGAPAAPTPFEPNATGVSETPPPARAVITALTGGGSQALDGQLASFWKLGETVIILADGVAIWQLQAGTQATDTVAGYVRPADFHATLNARVFVRLVWQGKIDAEAAALAAQAYRDAAQVQATAAAASATQAALVVASQFKGGASGAAVPASLTNAGEWVVITADGTSQSIAWTRGDRAHWTGVAGSYVRVPGQLVDELRVQAGTASRAVAPYLLIDGVTAGARGYAALGPHAAALTHWTLGVRFTPRQLAINNGIIEVGASAFGTGTPSAISLIERPATSYRLSILGTLGGLLTLDFAGAPLAIGRETLIVVTRAGATVSTYFDGQLFAPQIVNNTLGAAETVAADYLVVGRAGAQGTWTGRISDWLFGPGVWTADEVATHAQRGIEPDWWVAATGSAKALYTSDFSAGVDGWSGAGGDTTLTADTDAIDGQNDWLKVARTAAGVGRADIARDGLYITTIPGKAGHKYTTRARIHNPAGSGITHFALRFGVADGGAETVVPVPENTTSDISVFVLATAQTASGVVRIQPSTPTGMLATNVAQGTTWYVKLIAIACCGPVAVWTRQPGCAVAADAGASGLPCVLTPGATMVGALPAQLCVPGPAMTADGFPWADQLLVLDARYALTGISVTQTGTAINLITIRETSSGGAILASGALSATATRVPLTLTAAALTAGGKKLHVSGLPGVGNPVTPFFVYTRVA